MHRLNQCREINAKVRAAVLTVEEMYLYLLTRIVPAICYASAITNIPDKICQQMNTYIDSAVVPKLGLNRHFPKAVLYGPLEMGGLNYPQFKTIQATR